MSGNQRNSGAKSEDDERHGFAMDDTLADDGDSASLKRYVFSLGDTVYGPIGFVVHVVASSANEALALLRNCFTHFRGVDLGSHFCDSSPEGGILHFDVYFNPDEMSEEDIEEVDSDVEGYDEFEGENF